MIVQPASLGPRSGPRRALRLAALIVPVVLLASVIAIGVLGPQPAPAPQRASDAPVAVADGSPVASAPSDPSPSPEPAGPVFPSELADLDVHGVRWTLEARNRGLARGVIAVAGYLGLDTIPAACRDATLGVFGAFCDRVGVLGEDPWFGATNSGPEPPGFHLHPQFPPGVRIPSQATFVAISASTQTPAVILLGRFNDDRAATCVPGGRHCGQEFIVERVAWVRGDEDPGYATVGRVDRAAFTGAELRRETDCIQTILEGEIETFPLLLALVRPGAVGELDPAMAPAAAGLPPDEPVWAVRVLATRGDPRVIRWALVPWGALDAVEAGTIETVRPPGTFGAGGGSAPSP